MSHARAEDLPGLLRRTTRSRFAAALALALALVVGLPLVGLPLAHPAAASCALDERPLGQRIDEVPTAFVGTVLSTRHDGTTADVAVEEIWKGAPDIRRVVVQGGSGQDGMATSVDRSFTVGARYLFLPQAEGSLFTDNSCSPTQQWSPELAALRPEDAQVVDADEPGTDAASPVVLLAIVALLGLGGLAAGWAWRRHHARA